MLLKKRCTDRFIGALACGFHRLKHLSGLSYICTLAKYGFSFKQYLSRIYQGQIWKHICPTFVVFTTRTNITSDLSYICPEAKYDQIIISSSVTFSSSLLVIPVNFVHFYIVNRGDSLWSPANIKGANDKDAKIYVGRSTTVHNLLFYAHTLCTNYVTKAFLWVSSSVSSKQLLCFVHGYYPFVVGFFCFVFPIIVNYYFQVSFNLKAILYAVWFNSKCCDMSSFIL